MKQLKENLEFMKENYRSEWNLKQHFIFVTSIILSIVFGLGALVSTIAIFASSLWCILLALACISITILFATIVLYTGEVS